jgi:hypothetical protein
LITGEQWIGKEVKVQEGKKERMKESKGWKYGKYDSPLQFSSPFPVVDIIREMSKIKHVNMKPDD